MQLHLTGSVWAYLVAGLVLALFVLTSVPAATRRTSGISPGLTSPRIRLRPWRNWPPAERAGLRQGEIGASLQALHLEALGPDGTDFCPRVARGQASVTGLLTRQAAKRPVRVSSWSR
jgi:hypothetical protein